MSSNIENNLAERLKSSNTSEIYETLVKIRKNYVRNQDKMKKLEKYSVIKLIIPLMEQPQFCNLSLSIIADGCLDLSFVYEVIKCDGPKALIRIMKSSVNDDIHNRACRALGNIAKFDVGFKAIQHLNPISNIINFLSETKDANCQQTAVRTLMILGKSSKTRELIAQENGFFHIGKLLNSSNVQVLTCSIKAVANLTYNCTISCARQLLDFEFHKVLVELHSHSDKSVRDHALISLRNLSSLEEIRSGLVKVGAVNLFTKVLSGSESCEMSRYAALALCKCLDHIHMWSHNGTDRSVGLKALLTVLKDKNLKDIHIAVLSSLIPLSYEFNVTDILLNLDVLQILIEILDDFVKKYECKAVSKVLYDTIDKDSLPPNNIPRKENEVNELKLSQKLSENSLSKDYKKFDSFENMLRSSIFSAKSPDYKYQPGYKHKWDCSIYGLSSQTSDFSGSCSPSGTCSPPMQKDPASPEFNYDIGSPSTANTSSGIWSPASLMNESMPYNENCWSPVVSTHSNSPVRESEFVENEDSLKTEFLLFENFNATFFGMQTEEDKLEMPISSNSSSIKSKTVEEIKRKISYNDSESMISSKKLKRNTSHTNDTAVDMKKYNNDNSVNSENIANCSSNISKDSNVSIISLTCSETVNMSKESKMKDISNSKTSDSVNIKNSIVSGSDSKSASKDNGQSSDSKLLIKTVERRTIDHYVILFIFQISFHIEKKTDSHMAAKSFFSVLLNYLCLIHKPSLKAEAVLSNLIKNRYCLEKLILNGFFNELEVQMFVYGTVCAHHPHVLTMYVNLLTVAREEIESDYGLGTLIHILLTSERKGQLHAICALSKLIIKKRSLYKLLIESNGLTLLLEFLSDSDDKIKKRAVWSLHRMYRSLSERKEYIPVMCCFKKTCALENSTKCCYKTSFFDVTFVVGGGAKILANREKVCANSDYFQALLQGHFQESNSQMIVLPHISAENLSTIFHFLHGCGKSSMCPYITRIPFCVLLELLSDCERFLLLDIKTFVEDRLCHGLLTSHIPEVYKQAKLHNSPALAKRALTNALKIFPYQKHLLWHTFKEILNSGSSVNVYSDIEEMLKELLLDSPDPLPMLFFKFSS